MSVPVTVVIMFHITYIIFGILAVLVNAVILSCVFRLKSLNLNRWLILPAVLLAADTLLSFGYAIGAGITLDQYVRTKQLNNVTVPAVQYKAMECILINFAQVLGSVLDQLIAVSIAVERVAAIVFPIWHHANSMKIVKYCLYLSLFTAFAVSLLSFANLGPGDNECTTTSGFEFSYRTFYYLFMCCLCVLAAAIYSGVIVSSHYQQRKLTQLSPPTSTIIAWRILNELSVTKIITEMIVAYSIINLLAYITISAMILNLSEILQKWGMTAFGMVLLFCQFMITLNTPVNSFLYVRKNPIVKNEIVKLKQQIFKKFFERNVVKPTDSRVAYGRSG